MQYLEVHVFYQEEQVNRFCKEPGNDSTEVEVQFPHPPERGYNPRPVYIIRVRREVT